MLFNSAIHCFDVDADISPANQSNWHRHSEMLSVWFCTLLCVRLAFGSDIAPAIETDNGDLVELVILHNNDMHSRFEETDEKCNVCSEKDAAQNKCYGGFARVRHV